MENKYIKNSATLGVALIISKIIGAIYKIPLSNILSSQGMGIYQLIFPIFSLFLIFITGGLPVFLSQKVSSLRATNKQAELYGLFKKCLFIAFVFGLILSFVMYFFAKNFAVWQGNEFAEFGYKGIAFCILISGLLGVFRGYSQGFENFVPTAFTTILGSVFKLFFSLILAVFFAKKSIYFGVFGAFVGIVVSETFCLVFCTFYFTKKRKALCLLIGNDKTISYLNIFKGFMPINTTNILLPLMGAFESFVVVNLLTKTLFNYKTSTSLFGIATGMATPIVNFPIALCSCITLCLLPAFSFAKNSKQDTQNIVRNTFLFVFVFALPCAFGLFSISNLIIPAFFPVIEDIFLKDAILYMSIISFDVVFMCIIQLCVSVLNGAGNFKLPLIAQLVSLGARATTLVLLLLFSNLGILSLCISILVGQTINCLINLYFVKKITKIKFNKAKIASIFISAAIMAICLLLIKNILFLNIYVMVFLLVLIAAIVYFTLILLFRVVRFNDFSSLIKSVFKK